MSKNVDIKVIMGANIAKARRSLGYSQEYFAELVSISVSTLSKIETGRNQPKAATLAKILDKLGIKTQELLLEADSTENMIKIKENTYYVKLLGMINEHRDNKDFLKAVYEYAKLLKNVNK